MGEFSAEWLALREPADLAARADLPVREVARWLERHGGRTAVDLACGTGSNLRGLLRRLRTVERWLLIDHDRRLLDRVPGALRVWGGQVGLVVGGDGPDISIRAPDDAADRTPGTSCAPGSRGAKGSESPGILGGSAGSSGSGGSPGLEGAGSTWLISVVAADLMGPRPWLTRGVSLVTASALMDLVSEVWLAELVRDVCAARAAFLVALTYDGRMELSPEHPLDTIVRGLVNRHQQTDKGFGGPALGPGATAVMERLFVSCGYEVVTAKSDWVLTIEQRELQRELMTGWAQAALELEPAARTDVEEWLAFRMRQLDLGHSRALVGHEDLAAFPEADLASV